MKKIWLFLVSLLILFAEPNFPELSGRVVDDASILTKTQIKKLSTKLSQHEQVTSNQIVVVTLKSLQNYDIADYGYQLGRYWQIGQKGKDNGVLLIVAPNERKVRIEVGYGLEGALTDALSKEIIETKIIPQFRIKNYFAGIDKGVDTIISVINGEYQNSSISSKSSIGDLFMPLVFLIFFIFSFIPKSFHSKPQSKQILPALITSTIFGIITYIIFSILLIAFIVGVGVFILIAFGKRDSSFLHDSGGFNQWGNRDFGGGFGGGFSGGGGSFGGGGASGSW